MHSPEDEWEARKACHKAGFIFCPNLGYSVSEEDIDPYVLQQQRKRALEEQKREAEYDWY